MDKEEELSIPRVGKMEELSIPRRGKVVEARTRSLRSNLAMVSDYRI